MNANIIWLASYPKSGNTWFRLFLNALLCDLDKIDINNLPIPTPIASERSGFLSATGLDSGDLTDEEIYRLRPHVHRYFSQESEEIQYHKVHDAYHENDQKELIFPCDVTKGAIYFVRNPLDVCISYTHHQGNENYEKMLDFMDVSKSTISKSKQGMSSQMPQRLSTWAEHVVSWLDITQFPVLLMRYEDMLENPLETFKTAAKFLDIDKPEETIAKAIQVCSFKNLQEQEAEKGFQEKLPMAKQFFYSAQIGQWHGKISLEKSIQFTEKHQTILKRLGYINQHNQYFSPLTL